MALGKLDQVCAQLPDPRVLIRPALWREALDTSALEGTVGALRELLEARLPSTQFLSPETIEVRAYEEVAMTAFKMIAERPISVTFLSELQAQLFKDAESPPPGLGRLRTSQVWIGEKTRPVYEARFVPPPADDRLRAGIDAWITWIQTEHEHLAPLVRAAISHYQFETLHPFADGNGRIGRLVVVLQLLRSQAIHWPAITLSPWFLRHRTEYQDHLLEISCTGNWNPWIRFFCEAVVAQCESLIVGAEFLLKWLTSSRRLLDERRWTGKIHQLLSDLIEWPVTTIADTAARYDVSVMNATRMIGHLVEVEILKELTGKNYGRIFGATDVMDAVERI